MDIKDGFLNGYPCLQKSSGKNPPLRPEWDPKKKKLHTAATQLRAAGKRVHLKTEDAKSNLAIGRKSDGKMLRK